MESLQGYDSFKTKTQNKTHLSSRFYCSYECCIKSLVQPVYMHMSVSLGV